MKLEYYHKHFLVAAAISAVAVLLPVYHPIMFGAVFLAGMLRRDFEKEPEFDAGGTLRFIIFGALLSTAAWFLSFHPIAVGAMFYCGRELRDRERLGTWDRKGLLYPLVPAVCAQVLVWLF